MYPSTTGRRIGTVAGVVLTALVGVPLFVGPWRMFTLGAGGTFPVGIAESASGNPLVLAAAGTVLVGFVAGTAYPQYVDEADESRWSDVVLGLFVPQVVAVAVVLVGLMLSPAVDSLLSGAVARAAAQVTLGVLLALVLYGSAMTVLAIAVGVPAIVAVYAGVAVGSAAAPD